MNNIDFQSKKTVQNGKNSDLSAFTNKELVEELESRGNDVCIFKKKSFDRVPMEWVPMEWVPMEWVPM